MTIDRLETGHTQPRRPTINKLAAALGCTPDSLLGQARADALDRVVPPNLGPNPRCERCVTGDMKHPRTVCWVKLPSGEVCDCPQPRSEP